MADLAEERSVGRAYLEHLTDEDLRLVARAHGPTGPDAGELRARPELVPALLGHPGTVQAVLADDPAGGAMLGISPFLVFVAGVQATADELDRATHVEEWLGPRQRAHVFDVVPLRELLSAPWRRLFLAQLLASYTRVASGSVMVATRRGLRRRRFSELDPVKLAGLLDVVPGPEHPGVYRRLGDLALFLTGVFPDHTALHALSPVDEERLLRAGRLRPPADSDRAGVPGFGGGGSVVLLERLGRRWYQLAHDLVPAPLRGSLGAVGEMAERFGDARRILNVLTDRRLFALRAHWFGVDG